MRDSDRLGELIHDMRNRLTVARANVEAFIDGKLPPTQERLRSVLQSLNQVDELLKDFRVTRAVVDSSIRPTEINVCAILEREYQAVEAVASAKGVSFRVTRCPVTADQCAHFVGDQVRLGQIVTNIILNAVRYTPVGGAVDVDCATSGDGLVISISDTGPGVAVDEAERIFEAGFRGAAAEGTTGSGYGLAIVKELVEAQGGSVTVSASASKGARFVVTLPGTVARNGIAGDRCASCGFASRGPVR